MFKTLSALAVSGLLLVSGAAHAQSGQPGSTIRPLTSSMANTVLMVRQETSLLNDTHTEATLGPVTASFEGLGGARVTTKLFTSPVQPLEAHDFGGPRTPDAVRAAAKEWVGGAINSYAARLSGWMRKEGVASASVSFNQEVMVLRTPGGPPVRRTLNLTAVIDSGGRAMYGDPELINPDPIILEAKYFPKTPGKLDGSGFHTSWNYGVYSGQVQYRLLDKKMNELQGWRFVDVHGAYDRQELEGVEEDQTDAPYCLADHDRPQCSPAMQAQKDLSALMIENGADLMRLFYVNTLSPEYEEPDATGYAEPRMGIDVTERVFDCSIYSNSGRIGFRLLAETEVFTGLLTQSGLNVFSVGKSMTSMVSDEYTYGPISVAVRDLQGRNADRTLISVLPQDPSPLWDMHDAEKMRRIIHVAPLTVRDGSNGLDTASFSGNMRLTEDLALSSGATRVYWAGTPALDNWGEGMTDAVLEFALENPAQVEEFVMLEEHYDDFLRVSVNGVQVFNGPFGGDMLKLGTRVNETGTCTQEYVGGPYRCMHLTTYVGQAQFAGWGRDWEGNMVMMKDCAHLPGSIKSDEFCYMPSYTAYDWCSSYYNDGGENGSSSGWVTTCGHGCAAQFGSAQVQTHSNAAVGSSVNSGGCWLQDQKTLHHHGTVVDLLPYLRAGHNQIRFELAVGGKGTGYVKLRTRTCGGGLGTQPAVGVPVVPGDIVERLRNQR